MDGAEGRCGVLGALGVEGVEGVEPLPGGRLGVTPARVFASRGGLPKRNALVRSISRVLGWVRRVCPVTVGC